MAPKDPSAVAMGVFLLVVGLALLLWMRRRQALARASEGWPTAEGRVVRSEVRRYWAGQGLGRRYAPHVAYEYEVDGNRYRGDRLCFDPVTSTETWARGVAGRYSPGAAVKVHFDPRRPRLAVLEPGRSGAYNYGLIGCSLAVVGLFFVVYLGFLK